MNSRNKVLLNTESFQSISGHPSRGFDGYVDRKATEKKIVRSVLKKGDMYFRSGDLLYADEFGWMYFMDRMGDTYRWVFSVYLPNCNTVVDSHPQ